MSKGTVLRTVVLLSCLAVLWGGVSATLAAGETFQVVSVNTVGCNSGNFGMTVQRANLDGGTYIVHTVVTVGGLIYMNEQASISVNGLSGWNIFNNFTYGPVPNPGTYPIPSGQQMQLDFTLERPKGTILYTWRLVVDGCNSGNVIFNGVPSSGPSAGSDMVPIPEWAVVGTFTTPTALYFAPEASSASTYSMGAGQSLWVFGIHESGDFYQVLLSGQMYWVPVSNIGPTFLPPWNGTPLPTTVVP